MPETVKKPSRKLLATPKLRHGDDSKIAQELESYITDAENGVRAILRAGFFIECIAADLPQGQLGPWIQAHCPNREPRTVQRWKQVASKLADDLGISYKKRLDLKLHNVIALPLESVPAELKPIREKIDKEIAGKSYRQLFFQFVQCTQDGTPTRGNFSGKGNPKANRAAAAAADDAARNQVTKLEAAKVTKWLDDKGDDKGIGTLPPDEFKKLLKAMETALSYMRQVQANRKEVQ